MIKTMVLDPTYKSQSFSVEQKLATQAEKELREVLKELQEGYFETVEAPAKEDEDELAAIKWYCLKENARYNRDDMD